MNKCKYCKKEFIYDRSKGHRKHVCHNCNMNKWRISIKIRLIDILGGECEKCGYKKCINALEFHHKDSKLKEFSISKYPRGKFDKLVKEVKKCTLLCSNCHREIHNNHAREMFNL